MIPKGDLWPSHVHTTHTAQYFKRIILLSFMFSVVQGFEKTQLENSDLDVSSIWSIARAHPNGLNQPSAFRQKQMSSVGFLQGPR